jgi:hypothetical protein
MEISQKDDVFMAKNLKGTRHTIAKRNYTLEVFCNYCNEKAKYYKDSSIVYWKNYGPIWLCLFCQAWVGCHPNGKPLGRLADADLRRIKIKVHEAFDPLWMNRKRNIAYNALAKVMNINRKDCHIGLFDTDQCLKAIEACNYGLVLDEILSTENSCSY